MLVTMMRPRNYLSLFTGMSEADAEEVRRAQHDAEAERAKQSPVKKDEARELQRQQREATK